jgi:hypothetical protein
LYSAINPGLTAAPLRRAAARDRVPVLLTVMVAAIFLPEALGFLLFGLRFTLARFVFFVAAPFLAFAFLDLLRNPRYRFVLADLLIPLTSLWMIVALATTDGLESAIKSGGATALDFAVPYLAARTLLQTRVQLHAVIRLFCLAAAIAGLLGLLDVIANEHVLREGLARLTGYQFYYQRDFDQAAYSRLGVLRAQGPLEHPILFGVMMTYALLLASTLTGRAKLFCWIGCGLGLFFSVSSGAWEALILGLGLMFYGRFVDLPWKWGLLAGGVGLALTLFFLIMSNPLGWIFNHFTLDASTGYFRTMIWEAAGADVMDSPVFGIGAGDDWFRPSWMPSSVDALWLRAAMLYGVPGSLLIALSLWGANSLPTWRTAWNRGRIGTHDAALGQTLGILTFLSIFIGFTVFYWGSVWYALGLFAGLRATLGQIAAGRD